MDEIGERHRASIAGPVGEITFPAFAAAPPLFADHGRSEAEPPRQRRFAVDVGIAPRAIPLCDKVTRQAAIAKYISHLSR
jgi:hypothetical protein